MIYYFIVEHISENEEVVFSITANTFEEAETLAQLINPTAKFNGETKESPKQAFDSIDDGLPF